MLGRRENKLLLYENGWGDNVITLAKKADCLLFLSGERPEDLNLGQIWKLGSKQSKKQRLDKCRMKVEKDVFICIYL